MKLAVVVQRYGAQINGGAELHARYIVELLAKHHSVEVLTTCARDYVTWHNEYAEGSETLRGVPIRRFPVSHERVPEQFHRDSVQVFERPHSLADELAWLDSEGPTSPALIAHLRAHDASYDYVIFFSYRYYLAYHGIRAMSNKAILVPTAERDSALGLGVFGPIFRGVRALMYNSPEERALIQAVSQNTQVPGVVVGVGSDVPRHTSPERFRQKYHLHDPFILYVGRIDENKGCRELFSYFTSYQPRMGQRLSLVLIGNSILPIPKHSSIRHLGYVSDQDKFDALAAAELLAMPSYYESLSMVALEAWALGKPVLANGRCDVLRGQCIRSRAGLFYDSFDEFAETLFTLTTYRPLNESLGENGRRFYDQHYAWPVIERKYLDVLNQLAAEDAAGRKPTVLEPLPGWLTRRRKTLQPAEDIVKALPHDVPRSTERLGSSSTSTSTSTSTAAAAASARTSADTGRNPSPGAAAGAAGGATSSSPTGDRDHDRDRRGRRDRDGSRRSGGDRRGRGDRRGDRPARESRGDRDREARDGRGDRDREGREGRDGRGEREREGRDPREARNGRGERDREGRDNQDARDGRGDRDREGREGREGRGEREREGRDSREARDGRGERDREGREGRDGRDQADRGERSGERSEPGAGRDAGGEGGERWRDGRRMRRRPRPDDGRRRNAGPAGSGGESGGSGEQPPRGDPNREPNASGNSGGDDRQRRRRRSRGGRSGPRGPRESG